MYIQKRDGTKVPFDRKKIEDAVNKALIEVDGELYETDTAESIAIDVENALKDKIDPSVEEIQDIVEVLLMNSERQDVAQAYIRYRYKKEVARKVKSDFFDAIGEKLEARNVQNQNANVDEHSFGGRLGEAASLMTKQYALDYIVSPMARKRHLDNEIYIHDLDSYATGMHNCLSIPFDKLLAEGFNTRQTDVRPANSINTAMQLVAVIFQLQSLQQFGGVSATHLDWTMVPYVRKSFFKHYVDGAKYVGKKDIRWIQENIYDYLNDPECFQNKQSIDAEIWKEEKDIYQYAYDMTVRETHQAVEALYHNLEIWA